MMLSLPFLWGYLPILWTIRRQAAFDLFAGTVVTVVPPLVPPARFGAGRSGSVRLVSPVGSSLRAQSPGPGVDCSLDGAAHGGQSITEVGQPLPHGVVDTSNPGSVAADLEMQLSVLPDRDGDERRRYGVLGGVLQRLGPELGKVTERFGK